MLNRIKNQIKFNKLLKHFSGKYVIESKSDVTEVRFNIREWNEIVTALPEPL